MKQVVLLMIVSTILSSVSLGQTRDRYGLGVGTTAQQLPELFQLLENGRGDTAEVNTLLAITRRHWTRGVRDSVGYWSVRAGQLAKKLHFGDGFDEAMFLACKFYSSKGDVTRAQKILKQVGKDQQARLSLVIGEHFLFLPGLKQADLDTAIFFFNTGLALARAAGIQQLKHQSLIAIGKYYFAADNFSMGKASFLEIIGDLKRIGDRSAEAHIWSELGKYMPETDSTFPEAIAAHEMARKIYDELKDTAGSMYEIEDMAVLYMLHGNYVVSQEMYLKVLELRKVLNRPRFQAEQLPLAVICLATGRLDEGLRWALAGEKNAARMDDHNLLVTAKVILGQIYDANGDPNKSLHYLLSPELEDPGKKLSYHVASLVTRQYLAIGEPKKAMQFINRWEKQFPAEAATDRETLAAVRGDVHAALKQPAIAEKYYIDMIGLDDLSVRTRKREVDPFIINLTGSEAYYKIARFYADQHRFEVARSYADKALGLALSKTPHFLTAEVIRKTWWTKFQIDSALGNYLTAIRHYKRYTELSDSIFNTKRSNQLQLLQVQYDTEKKEADIQARDNQISSLKQNDILRQANLAQAHTIRNIMIASSAILLILGVLVYRQYMNKRRSAKVLQDLLTDKEWLLKEIHHRVKNNLHTIICLLESQAAYLEDDALDANEVSQQRIYAMSLIHQKIYQSDDIKTIAMEDYLPELIRYLDDSFGNDKRIQFDVQVDPAQLDITQAIPVALIINEAVANSIKHAFPSGRNGKLDISLRRHDDEITVIIKDDGIGINASAMSFETDSLGLQLIRGLSKEIRGKLKVENEGGTEISVVFKLSPLDRESNGSVRIVSEKAMVTNQVAL